MNIEDKLINAAKIGNEAIVNTLLASGANINYTNQFGVSALMILLLKMVI